MANPANKWLVGSISAALIAAVTLWEGVEYTPYKDIAGVITVCMGYTGKDIVLNKVYTKAECDALLKKELPKYQQAVYECINKPMSQKTFDAFTLFAYNVGTYGFCHESRAARLYNQGYYPEACNAMAHGINGKPAWSYATKQGKKVFVQGLYNRRLFEKKMCEDGL